eukprot:4614984-Prorocentrum_lima.AAC.1
MTSSLVGSEMCIRDRLLRNPRTTGTLARHVGSEGDQRVDRLSGPRGDSVSYTHLTLPTICSV